MRAKDHRADVVDPEPGTRSLWDVREFSHINFSWHTLWLYMGPGWLMSIAFLDPGNIEGERRFLWGGVMRNLCTTLPWPCR